MKCCCGKYDLTDGESLTINDHRHEAYGPTGNFCGPDHHHVMRDLVAERDRHKAALEQIHQEALLCHNHGITLQFIQFVLAKTAPPKGESI